VHARHAFERRVLRLDFSVLIHKFTAELMKIMKRLFIFLLVIIGIQSYGQPLRESLLVRVDPVPVVCLGGKVVFVAKISSDSAASTYYYKWLFKNQIIADSVRPFLIVKNISLSDTGLYRCVATDSVKIDTSNAVRLSIHAPLHIDTLYRYNALGCPTDSNAQMKIKVSGGNQPYTYNWGGGAYHQLDTLGIGFAKGTYLITVYDSDTSHCVSREFTIKTLVLHKITFHTTNPPDSIYYLSNPFVTVAIPDSAIHHLDSWNWDFDDKTPKVPNQNPCVHEYTKIGYYKIFLNFTDNIGGQLCDSTIFDSIQVKTIRLFVPNAITPGSGDDNGSLNIRELSPIDGKPAGTNLDLSEIYLSNEMFIYNRHGQKVFDKTNYKNGDWDGGNLSAGVYFYLLKCHGEFGDEVYRGAVTIIRK
jgi:hypothetical protein